MLEPIIGGLEIVFSWPTIAWLILGLFFGIFCGAIPGLGATLGMAIALPLTFPMDSESAIIFLVSIYSGGMYGGSIAAILINVPGTSAAAATTLDGYPLSRKGLAREALSISATSSGIAGIITIITLILISPFLVQVVLLFGTPEYFLMAFLGLAMITFIVQGSMIKGLIAGFMGLGYTTIGFAPMDPEPRYTLGYLPLYDGLNFIVAIIGLFAIAEMLKLSREKGSIEKERVDTGGRLIDGVKNTIKRPITLIKSSYIGMLVGAVPGAGASISTFVAYGEASRSSNEDTFGQGNKTGVVATESSNNATISGSLIPAISFGIPGSSATAVLIGGLIMHGLIPGPDLFADEIHTTYSMFIALLIGNILILAFGLTLLTKATVITRINTEYIIPVIIVLGITGAFAIRTNWIDIVTVVFLGILGYYMKTYGYSLIAFILGAVLGSIIEENMVRTIQLTDGSILELISRPISALLLFLIVIFLATPLLQILRK